ncbi:Protein of unknown function [Cotesia congregata]|uniref:Uncharacterized protein n=1 Tax=Cotesia congregata TaxID=51543 RepID=A0A8J2EMC9_COTCN|nr:Protein of unknown function [Cotesia congregata]
MCLSWCKGFRRQCGQILTGVKFELKNLIIHLQIEEGKLLSGGRIDTYSIHMKELEIFEYSTYPKDRLELVIDDELMRLEESVDYIFVKQERRYINLDNVFFREPGYVVTGLKLSVDPENFESLQLAVHITPFDFDSGSLTPTDDKPSKWIIYKYMSDEDRKFENRRLVALQPRIPLEGVSLYYRGKENSAGFVGFRMTTLDIPAYLDPQMSQQDLEFL